MKQPDFIEKILLEKEYNQLTAEEKTLVNEWIAGEEEYNVLRNTLAGIQFTVAHDALVQPSAQTSEKIKAAFTAARHRKPVSPLRYIVLGLSVAAAVLVFVSVWMFTANNPQPKPTAGTTKTETITLPPVDFQPMPDTLSKTPVSPQVKEEPAPQAAQLPETTGPEPVEMETATAQSISMDQNEDLMAMTVPVF